MQYTVDIRPDDALTIPDEAIHTAVNGLLMYGATVVELCPGDMTRYVVGITDLSKGIFEGGHNQLRNATPAIHGQVRDGGDLAVSLFTCGQRCAIVAAEEEYHPAWLADHFGANPFTGALLAAFLGAVVKELNEERARDDHDF